MRRFLSGTAAMLVASLSLTGCGGGAAGTSAGAPGLSSASNTVSASAKQNVTVYATTMRAIEHPAYQGPESAALVQLARLKIKHVFVIVQENHTFDQYFGLYPGVNGQSVENLGTALAQQNDCEPDPVAGGCQRPFLISANPNSPNYVADAADITGGDNSRFGQESGIDHGKMDGFLAEDESGEPVLGPTPSPTQIAEHNESIGIEGVYDCDTIPYLWYYAKNFALFDHYFQGNTGPSTPGNIQLFAGQIGQTEAAAGVAPITQPESGGNYSDGVPIANDDNPPASNISFIANSYGPDSATVQSYATMPVMLDPAQDRQANKVGDVGFIGQDMAAESLNLYQPSIPWTWYQEGLYTGSNGFSAHHAAPLYFNYINSANSPFATQKNLRDNKAGNGLISDIQNGTLPGSGVFWVKGANDNSYGLEPADPIFSNNSSGSKYYQGDDDHPGSGDSDHQVGEAYLAQMIDAIAQSRYWKDSLIVVTWDDSGGFYDHVAPQEFGATCPQDLTGPEEGYSCGEGVRLPALVISPFAKNGAVVHTINDHGSVSKAIEAIFNLPHFGTLPNEAVGVKANLSPADGNPTTGDLLGALDFNKLDGSAPVNPASLAEIPSPSSSPSMNCATLGITPIPAPAPLPAGYQTAGYYLHQQLAGQAPAIKLPDHDDSGD